MCWCSVKKLLTPDIFAWSPCTFLMDRSLSEHLPQKIPPDIFLCQFAFWPAEHQRLWAAGWNIILHQWNVVLEDWPSSVIFCNYLAWLEVRGLHCRCLGYRWSSETALSTPLTAEVRQYQRTTLGRRAFSVAGLTVWNSLPDELRDETENTRHSLKTLLFRQC